MGRVIHFEIHAEDPEKCAHWYANLFGWTITEYPDIKYWTIETGEGPGINGGIVRRVNAGADPGAPVNAFVCTILVENLDRTLAAALANGGKEMLAKFAVPGAGWTAYVIDPFGNVLGLHQADASVTR